MREIKFRGLRTKNKEWVYGDLLNHPNGTRRILSLEQIGDNFELIDEVEHNDEVMPETVGQYTGLKDCNGKEIYEDDLVKCKHWNPSVYRIEFIEGAFCLTHPEISIPTDVTHLEDSTGKHFTFFGNIHQNPVLL